MKPSGSFENEKLSLHQHNNYTEYLDKVHQQSQTIRHLDKRENKKK